MDHSAGGRSHIQMKRPLTIVLALSLAGCAAPPPQTTSSRRPEVTIKTANVQKFRARAISRVLRKGGDLISETPSQLTFSRPIGTNGEIVYKWAMGNSWAWSPMAITTITFVTEGATTRIFAGGKMDMRNAFGGDQGMDARMGAGAQIQQSLEEVKAESDK